ncbi:heavy metal translocating P-type ATPase [Caldalkalibacillus mannanilyticus]|uniref:heavy metal translocating P-type ATPase n=1 Tax=Caldalkalibacillus mannanilyticus TaxID=1418 RepID=UPI002277352D|nr:heavy metal translocating P-type ATPase [Caldalkalibacillus mannanilyticus]
MTRTNLHIVGMTCAACAYRIERGLMKLKGLEEVQVNFALGKASISYNAQFVQLTEIEKRIEKLGFHSQIHHREEDAAQEVKRLTKMFFLSALLSLPFMWGMLIHLPWTSSLYVPELFINPWFQLFLTTPIQFVIAQPFYEGAWKALKNRSANMDVLVVLSTTSAYLYSHYITMSMQGSYVENLYYETSAFIITFVLLGKLLESKTKLRTKEALIELYQLQEKKALVIRGHEEAYIDIAEVQVGDVLLIKPGQKVPLDGHVLEGETSIDESMITGESIPIEKSSGDKVIGGTINRHGAITIQVDRMGQDTLLSQIIRIVEDAQGIKAPIQRLADKIIHVFVPIVIMIAVLTFLVWYSLLEPNQWGSALEKTIAVLIIACPCALGLATPTSIMVGSGRAARLGILFKEGKHLEVLAQTNLVILDKTGTLTW